MSTTECNARITSTQFGMEDHDILTFYVMLEWQGGGQSLGGLQLDSYDEKTRSRSVGHGSGLVAMRRILEAVGVRRWEDLPGTLVRVRHHGYCSSKPPAIGHIIKDEWFDLGAFMEAEATR